MPTYTPTTNWSGIQKRTIDPKSKFDSDIINHITAIGGGDRYKVSGLDMDILYDTDNKLYFHLTPGIVVKDYVVLEFTADMYILAGTWPIANGTYYLAVEYQYAKQYPPNIAKIVFIPEAQLNGSKHYALFKITKTGNVFPTDLSYEQLAFSDEELAQPIFVERLAKKYVMTALGGETSIDISLYFDEYVKEYALYRNGLLQLEGYDFTFNHTTKVITMSEPLVAGDIIIFLSKMWGFANSELEEFGTYSIYDLDNGALDTRYYTKPQIDNFFEGTSAYVKNEVTRLNTPAPIILDSNIDNLTLSDDYIARRIIFTNPNPCTVYLPSSGLVEGFYCLVRNSGGGSLTAQVVSPAVLENSFSTWSDPTKYCSIMLESTQPYFSYFLMGGLE